MTVGGRTHIPKHDPAKCEACGGCTWRCPAAVFKELATESGSLRGAIFSSRKYPGKPADMPPCRMACPLGQDVPGYISAIAKNDAVRALEIVRTTNALPSVCGRVCLASCMRACVRAGIDEGVDIRGLKRYAAAAARAIFPEASKIGDRAKRVAVVGAGPAGLAAAHRFVQLGMKPVVFEAGDRAGGMLVEAIPSFVLPEEMVAVDVTCIEKIGVEIRTGTRVGKDVPWLRLEDEFDAVLVATGARKGIVSAISGRELNRVYDAVGFNRAAKKGGAFRLSGVVVVQGGGKAAVLSARSALRLGADEVKIVHPAPRDLWPAGADDLRFAEEEGAAIMDGCRVVGLDGSGKDLENVILRPVNAVLRDKVGRPKLIDASGDRKMTASYFISATERRAAKEDQPVLEGVSIGRLGNLVVDKGYKLGRVKWYAAGEAATGAATVVDSMATGRSAAESIHTALRDGRAGER